MKARFALCLALAAAMPAAWPVPAAAQALLPPYEIITSIRSMGLQPVGAPRLRGVRYVVRAIDIHGEEVRVAADAFSGRILAVRPMDRGPVYAERAYPPAYPDRFSPTRRYEQRGSYDRKAPLNPGEPSVIYAPREKTQEKVQEKVNVPLPKPAPKVAAKSPVQPEPPADVVAATPDQAPDVTTGTTTASPAPEKNPALVAPPVQAFD